MEIVDSLSGLSEIQSEKLGDGESEHDVGEIMVAKKMTRGGSVIDWLVMEKDRRALAVEIGGLGRLRSARGRADGNSSGRRGLNKLREDGVVEVIKKIIG